MANIGSSKAAPITIQPKNVYGLRTNVVGNVHFSPKQEVIYPVEGVLCFHDFITNKQKFLRFPDKISPCIITMSPNRKFVAILERLTNEAKSIYNVAIYDVFTLKKRRTVPIPSVAKNVHMAAIAFTGDSRALVMLSKPPEETIFLCLFDKADTVLHARVANNNMRGEAQCFACNQQEPGTLAVGGDSVFKVLTKSEKGFTVNEVKSDFDCITSMAWLSMDILVAGTQNAELLFAEAGEMRQRYNAYNTDRVDISHVEEVEEVQEPSATSLDRPIENYSEKVDERVVCLTAFPKGFAYAVFNTVYVYQAGESKFKFERKTILKMEAELFPEPLYQIMNLAVNSQQDTILVTPRHSQIYAGPLFVPETLTAKELNFETLGEPLHIDAITNLSICAWKPIVMTASKDQTIRIWNYETEKIELVKKYQVDVSVVELHPSGLFAAAGFSDQLRLMEILLEDLQVIKTYNFPRCNSAVFSRHGHKMAAAHSNIIAVISVFSFDTLLTLKGHNETILSLAFSDDDRYLFSGGEDGAVYQWDMDTGARVHEVVQKGIAYPSMAISTEPFCTYAVTDAGVLREISNSQIHREVKPSSNEAPLQCIALSRSNLVMFLGSRQGHLYNVQLPFMEAGGGTCVNYRFFSGAITNMKISYDDTLLVTASSEGTLAIWVIQNNENKIAPLDQDLGKCAEVLISRRVLIDRLETIASLELRMQQQADEFAYQKRQGDKFHSETVAEIHKGYLAGIEELKYKIDRMESAHVEQLNLITSNMAQTKEEHQQALQDLESKYHEKIIVEYEKSATIRKTMDEMRDDYESKLRKSAGCLQDTVEALETDFKKQLQERQGFIRQLMQEMEDKKTEFVEFCRQVEIDNDRNMIDSQLTFEKKIKTEQESTLKWRGQAGVLKKKHDSLSKENEELREEIDTLKEVHSKYQKTIAMFTRDIEDLRREIEERDFAIGDKEKRIQELQRKNQELEKHKQVLNHKIGELKAQIEPRERQIKEKRNQIIEMERELDGLQQNNMQLDLQLSELKDKYRAVEIELRTERSRARQARNHVSRICGEIYQVSKITDPRRLAEDMKRLFQKYSDSNELQRSIALDAEVEAEFQRQRDHVEKVAAVCKSKIGKKNESTTVTKLINENVVLLEELNSLRQQLKDAQKQVSTMESLLSMGPKSSSAPITRQKLDKIFSDMEDMAKKHRTEMDALQKQVELLTDQNQELSEELAQLALKAKPRLESEWMPQDTHN